MLDPRNRARNPREGKKGDAEEMPEKADSQGYPVEKNVLTIRGDLGSNMETDSTRLDHFM